MSRLCQQKGITLTPYGTVAGGFLSERYLGVPASQCVPAVNVPGADDVHPALSVHVATSARCLP